MSNDLPTTDLPVSDGGKKSTRKKMIGTHVSIETHEKFSEIAQEYHCSNSRLLSILVEDFVKNHADDPNYLKYIRII